MELVFLEQPFAHMNLICQNPREGSWAKSFYPPGIPYYWPVQGSNFAITRPCTRLSAIVPLRFFQVIFLKWSQLIQQKSTLLLSQVKTRIFVEVSVCVGGVGRLVSWELPGFGISLSEWTFKLWHTCLSQVWNGVWNIIIIRQSHIGQ